MNTPNLELTKESQLLFRYYNYLKIKSKNKFHFSQTSNNNSDFFKLQSNIFNSLNYIYNNLKTKFSYSYKKFREIYPAQSAPYKELVEKLYNKHFVSNKYISPEIKNFIKNSKDSSLISYKIPHNSSFININLFIYSNFSRNYECIITHILALIYLISYTTHTQNEQQCSLDGLTLNLFLTPFRREIEKNREKTLGAKNANGGFCYGCISHGDIVVYREEELFKVISHELIHNFGIDKYILDFNESFKNENSEEFKILSKFLKSYNLFREKKHQTFDIALQESLVEFWGSYFNIAIFSYNLSINYALSNNVERYNLFLEIFERTADLEIFHSFIQSTKILSFNNLSFNQLLLSKNNNSYKENTHLFSYYIIKLMLLYNYKKFISSNISTYKQKIYFQPSLKNIKKFLKYITDISKTKNIKSNFQFIEELYTALVKNNNKNQKFFLNNLRMTILEYN